MDAHASLPTCYRHDDRETRLACSSCGRPACVDCLRNASVGQKCAECAAPQGRERVVTAADVRGGLRQTAPVTFAILVACVAIWAAGFLSPEVRAVAYGLGAQDNRLVAVGEWYRIVSGAFLHAPGTLMHILFNMFALYIFGPQLEREAGSLPFATLYMGAAVTGGAVFYLLNPTGTAVGASGAIFGLFGAWLAAALRNRHTPAGQAGLRQLLLLLGINALLPLIAPNIAWEAHLGGFVAGLGIASVWFVVAGRPEAGRLRAFAGAAVGVGALLLVMLV